MTTFLVSAYIHHREPKILVERYKFLSPNRLEELSTFTLSLDLESQEIVVSYSREILSYAFYYCYYTRTSHSTKDDIKKKWPPPSYFSKVVRPPIRVIVNVTSYMTLYDKSDFTPLLVLYLYCKMPEILAFSLLFLLTFIKGSN